MRSRYGFAASAVLLVSIPVAFMVEMAFDKGAETTLHLALATGAALLAVSNFDFRLPYLVKLAASLSAALLAVIFILQAITDIFALDSLRQIAFVTLGQLPERVLVDVILLGLAAILISDSSGLTRFVGILTVGSAVAVELYSYWLIHHGSTLDAEFGALKLAVLGPFIWLALESWQKPA